MSQCLPALTLKSQLGSTKRIMYRPKASYSFEAKEEDQRGDPHRDWGS